MKNYQIIIKTSTLGTYTSLEQEMDEDMLSQLEEILQMIISGEASRFQMNTANGTVHFGKPTLINSTITIKEIT